jgi:hypothetical protein
MNLFRDLTSEEEAEFRQWARDHYEPFNEIKGIWHPCVQDECRKMNEEQGMSDRESKLAMFNRWLGEGDAWIGVFENHALDSADCGRRVALCFTEASFAQSELKKTHAPDHASIGLGWKYLLICKTHDAQEALDALESGVSG